MLLKVAVEPPSWLASMISELADAGVPLLPPLIVSVTMPRPSGSCSTRLWHMLVIFAELISDSATGTSPLPLAVLATSAVPNCWKPVPVRRSADVSPCCPEMENEAASAPLATVASRATLTTTAGTNMIANRFQRTRPGGVLPDMALPRPRLCRRPPAGGVVVSELIQRPPCCHVRRTDPSRPLGCDGGHEDDNQPVSYL